MGGLQLCTVYSHITDIKVMQYSHITDIKVMQF
jgi:hypothetical protein